MPLRFNLQTALDITPAVLAPGVSDAAPGLKAFEAIGLTIDAGEKYFHRVFDPLNANNNLTGTGSGPESFRLGNFPGFQDLGSTLGGALTQRDAQGLPLTFATLRLIALRVQPRIPYAPAAATGSLVSDNILPSNGETLTIGAKTYTFKTTLTSTEGEIKIKTTAALQWAAIRDAINHTGTPGTDYFCAAVHPTVTAGGTIVTSTTPTTTHRLDLTAITPGTAGNSIALATTSAHLALSYSTLTGGALVATPLTAAPLNGTVSLFLSNGLLPGPAPYGTVTADLVSALTVPGYYLFALESPWTPASGATVTIHFDGDGIPDNQTNAIVTLLMIGN